MQNKTVSFLFFLILSITTISAQSVDTLSLQDPYLSGDNVIWLQKILLSEGYDLGPWGADGYFGTATEEALKMYQFDNILEPTGTIEVSQLPQQIIWNPYTEISDGEESIYLNPQNDNITDIGTFSSLYGSISIPPFSWDDGDIFHSFHISPSQRFLSCSYYNPMSDLQAGQAIYIFDLLTNNYYSIYPIDIRDIPQEEAWQSMLSPNFISVYWTADEKLYLELRWQTPEGLEKSESFNIIVK